jgi:ribosome modulation factor
MFVESLARDPLRSRVFGEHCAMPRLTVEANWFEIFSAAVWGLLVFMGFRMVRLYGSASPRVAVVDAATQTEDPRDEVDEGPPGAPAEVVPSGDAGSGESDCGYEPGMGYSSGPSSDECPFEYEDRKELLWHWREEAKAWDRYQAELREQAMMAASDRDSRLFG